MKFFKPTLIAVALLAVAGCQGDAKIEEEKAPVLEAEIQKQAYGLGASIGLYMQRNLTEHDRLGLTLDKALIIRGFVDSINDKSVIEKEEIQALLANLDKNMKAKQQEMTVKESEVAIAVGQKFLEDNAKKEGVMVTESGIQYEVITAGEGDKPVATDTVKVLYKGTFLNGDSFDDRGEVTVFPLNRVIKGWTEGVQLMSVGSKYKFTIPSDLAYGPNGNPPRIPGNSVLQFEIELLEIQKPEPVPQVGEQAEK
ncbi:MAG: FKBP-type peptidyl-prolyl cis-trans isomerase [Kordiimonadaceae bacterium]|nr:FKBP-type peptidyl-prolyl cis-trans isomerase [Kordiimonadaceae bacterium]